MNISELQLKLQKTRRIHGAQIEILKQKLSAVNAELQALQTILHCELVEVEESLDRLNRAERSHRSVTSQLPAESFGGSKTEPSYQNGNTPEVPAV